MQKYTAIWQSAKPHESEWIGEIMGPYIAEHVTDGKHQLVLDNAILMDAFPYCFDPHYYEQFRGKNAFLVDFLDENYEGTYQLYANFRGVLRCFWSDVFDSGCVMKMPLGYLNGMGRSNQPIRRATERTYLWSFIGDANKSTRPDMARELASVEPHFMFSTEDVNGFSFLNRLNGSPKRFSSKEFSRILLDSTFSPCPMGNVNLESFRVYESLECGAIPIVEKRLTLDYFRKLLGDHPLPTVRSWRQARQMIRKLIRNPDDIDRLQTECVDWWDEYKKSLSASIGEFLYERSTSSTDREMVVSRLQRLPAWHFLELVRHHDSRALVRRVRRQATRLLFSRKMRVAHRPGIRLDHDE